MATVTETPNKSDIYISGYKAIANKLGVNENYLVTITASAPLGSIKAENKAFVGFTDETLSVNYSSSWSSNGSESSFLSNLIKNKIIKNKVPDEEMASKLTEVVMKKANQYAGINDMTLFSSAKIWNGSSSIALHIPFNFVFYENAKKEVKDQIKDLMTLAAPIDHGWYMDSPGPALGNILTGVGRRIQCKIGNAFLLDHCVITDVSSQIDMRFDQEGNPIAAKVDVGIESFFDSATAQMLDYFFEKRSWSFPKSTILAAFGRENLESGADKEAQMRTVL